MRVATDKELQELLAAGYKADIYVYRGGIAEVSFTLKIPGGGISGASYMSGDGFRQRQLRRLASRTKAMFGAKAKAKR